MPFLQDPHEARDKLAALLLGETKSKIASVIDKSEKEETQNNQACAYGTNGLQKDSGLLRSRMVQATSIDSEEIRTHLEYAKEAVEAAIKKPLDSKLVSTALEQNRKVLEMLESAGPNKYEVSKQRTMKTLSVLEKWEKMVVSDSPESAADTKRDFATAHLKWISKIEPLVNVMMDWDIPYEAYKVCETLLKKLKTDSTVEESLSTWNDITAILLKYGIE